MQELMGHKTIQMTCRYAHLAPKHRLAAVQRLCDTNAAQSAGATGAFEPTSAVQSKARKFLSLRKLQCRAGMAELADAADSKSAEGNLIGVRFPSPAP